MVLGRVPAGGSYANVAAAHQVCDIAGGRAGIAAIRLGICVLSKPGGIDSRRRSAGGHEKSPASGDSMASAKLGAAGTAGYSDVGGVSEYRDRDGNGSLS